MTLYLDIGIFIIICCLIYMTFRSRYQAKDYRNKLNTQESELRKLQTADKHLKSELRVLQNKLQYTLKDPVTNLLGWQLFEDRLQHSIKESARYQLNLGVMFVDVDNFKVINDAISYEVGDALLKETGERLQSCIRTVDSVSRFSKDMFAILLNQLNKPETAAIVAQRILQAFAEPFQIKGNEIYITVCIGIAIYPGDGEDATALLRSADQALQLAKEKGTHSYQFYQERMHEKSQRELSLYLGLSRETIFNELLLYYQPIINVLDDSIVCMDTLLYWQHPKFGLISPDELIHSACKQGKLDAITEWQFKNACRQYLNWQSLGFSPPLLGISIEMKQLENSHFVYRLSQILQEVGFKPEWLLLEIKSGISSVSFEILEKAFNMLKYLGVKIAIDHFGSSPLSFYHLKSFTVHYLKLDPFLIDDIGQHQQTLELIKSINVLATNLSLQVIIQGIESERQISILKDLGYSLMQGKFLGMPLSGQEVIEKMTVAT